MKQTNVLNSIKSALVIVVTTILIWLVADQYVREVQNFPVTVRIVSDSPDRYAAIVGPTQQITLNVRMAGRRRQLNAFEDLIKSKVAFEAMIDDTKPSSREPQFLSSLDDILRKIKDIDEARPSIKDVRPRTVKVRIDDYEKIPNVAVEPDFGDLQVNVTCAPKTVTVSLPRFAKEQFLSTPVIRPNAAETVREAIKGNADGVFHELPLVLSLGSEAPPGIRIVPQVVTLTGSVQGSHDTQTKGPVQITFSIPDEVEKDFAAVADPGTQFRRTIEVTGPKGRLDLLDPREIRAFVDVMAADRETPGKEIRRRVQYVLPPGFKLAPGSPEHIITFKLVPRSELTIPGS